MYRGYKIRNKKLDHINKNIPNYLAKSKAALRNETFPGVHEEAELNELYSHLSQKAALLERVIRARSLHHSRFYPLNLDYSHKAFLDKLASDRVAVHYALEKLWQRTAEVLHSKAKWFRWVRSRQDEEEASREKEVQRVKKESQMFRRHIKIVESRMKAEKRHEDAKRQEAYLNQVFSERMAERGELDSDLGEDSHFDPIEDVIEGERESYVEMMKRLLWLDSGIPDVVRDVTAAETTSFSDATLPMKATAAATSNHEDKGCSEIAQVQNGAADMTLTRTQKKRAKAKVKATESKKEQLVDPLDTPKIEVNETREQMRSRLLRGEEGNSSHAKTHALPEDEVDRLLEDVAAIKELLFCRLLLSQAAVLPAALKATSVAELLADPEVSRADLRDLCLQVEQPQLQEIRDACADLTRGDADEDDEADDEEEDEQTVADRAVDWARRGGAGRMMRAEEPAQWRSEHEEAVERRKTEKHHPVREEGGKVPTLVDFGKIEDSTFKSQKIRVTVCGRTIWNYPSEKAMARGGWLQFSVIAKGSKLEDSIVLCRNWTEFQELSTLACYSYFPSGAWSSWFADAARSYQLQLGLIKYLESSNAGERMSDNEATHRTRGARIVKEFKNITGAYIKRNDPISRRFVQYLSMCSGQICVLVRDGKTGRILVQPPEEHLWISRTRIVGGGMPKNDWQIHRKVGPELFEQLSAEEAVKWRFGFNDFYDVQIWDLRAGRPYEELLSVIVGMWYKASRFSQDADIFTPVADVLRSLHKDQKTGRVRDLLPGELSEYDRKVQWQIDNANDPRAIANQSTYYNDRDADEDMVLFPEETGGKAGTAIIDNMDPILAKLIIRGPSLKRFVLDIESDEDSDDYEDVDRDLQPGEEVGQRKIINQKEREMMQFPPCPNEDLCDVECGCPECEWFAQQTIGNTMPELAEHQDYSSVYSEDIDEGTDNMVMAERLKEFCFDDPWNERERDPATDWMSHVNREKSKIFKQQMHAAEFDPNAQEQWRQLRLLIEEAKEVMAKNRLNRVRYYRLLMNMGWHVGEHRLVHRDMQEAFTTVAMFFPGYGVDENSEIRQWKADVLQRLPIFDNASKAAGIPYNRAIRSNRTMPDDFWVEPDEVSRIVCNGCTESTTTHTHQARAPIAWDKFVRPLVAKLFKAGIIGPGYDSHPEGFSVVTTDRASRTPQNWYLDYREVCKRELTVPRIMRNPHLVDLLATAERFAVRNSRARYTLLRIWTHSHFYPNTLGYEKMKFVTFADCTGRSWRWTFIPKDQPDSDWSMQHNIDLQLARIKKQFGKNFEVKREMVLVMAEDEEKMPDLLTSIVFQLQTNQWRYEVDWWKSFVNVDLSFLAGLDRVWLD